MDRELLVFVGVSVVLALTPGPDMAVVTKNALAHGRRGVLLTTTPGSSLVPRLLLLGSVFGVMGWAWMNLYGLLVTRLRDVIGSPSTRRWMERVTGTVLIGLGARLALERL